LVVIPACAGVTNKLSIIVNVRGILVGGLAVLGTALHAENFTRPPVEVPAIGFQAVVTNGRVVATWKRYKDDDFYSYIILKSLVKESPVYPEDAAIFRTNLIGEIQYEDGKISLGAWHYRLCIVTRFGDRWMSPVITIQIGPEDMKRIPPTTADFE
jgi:hypothetical protein